MNLFRKNFTHKQTEGSRRTSLFTAFAFVLAFGAMFVSCQLSGDNPIENQVNNPTGDFIPDGSIAISSSVDMAKIGVDESYPLSGTYHLTKNITLSNWTPTGNGSSPFSGKFDGNGKTITITGFNNDVISAMPHIGIFSYVKGSDSIKPEIKNLKIVSSVNSALANDTTGHGVGLVTGVLDMAIIDNITLSGTFNFTSTKTCYVGGIAGYISGNGTVVKNSNSSLKMEIIHGNGAQIVTTSGVLSYTYVGGIVGLFQLRAGIENCHNTGDVIADNVKSSVSGQNFVGGIAGGGPYAFASDAHGYIHNSSFTVGTVSAKAQGFWSWAGGIAGCITGGHTGDKNVTTRIERCFASGTITVADTKSGFPYVGGIVGYVYYGAMVSQCYFTGNVTANSGSQEYVGGIAGYSSYATGGDHASGKACVIEDCWSSGKVSGYRNAGGIVGQNQQNTFLRRSYSSAVIETINNTNFGVGGITGLHASTAADAVTSCVALNPSITAAAGNYINRVTGTTTVNGTRSNNYALPCLVPSTTGTYTERKGLTEPDGADIPSEYLSDNKPTQAFYVSIGWDFTNVWKMGTDGYPKLKWQN